MAGQLVQINKAVGDNTSSVLTVTGINTDDVYMVAFHSLSTNSNNDVLKARVTTSGTPDSDSEDDRALAYISSGAISINRTGENADHWQVVENADDDNGGGQGILHLYNFNNSSKFSIYTQETVGTVSNQQAGQSGGGSHTVNEANDGFSIYSSNASNFQSGGTIVLYKVI